jgi:methionyl-tRNA formyltransferase
MAGDAETGVSIMRLTAGLDEGPVCLAGPEPIRADDDYGSLARRLEVLSGELLVRALDERPPFAEQPSDGVTYAHKIEAADRALDPARTAAELERVVRALRPHIGARVAMPEGAFLGVEAAHPGGPAVEPGHVRAVDGTLVLGAADGPLELTTVRPPGARAMPTADWLRGRPDPSLTDFEVPAA